MGCILANSFGLGKTDVGCMIARYYKELGKKILIIYLPVTEQHWKRTLEKVGLKESDVERPSRGMLQKGDFNYEKYQGIDLIIVDEAHHFRVSKPKSNRRENLENIIKEVIEKLNELIKMFSVRIEWPDLPLYSEKI